MNYIKHLTFFFSKCQADPDMAPCQIAIYLSLFQCWNKQRFENPITVIRDEIMRMSKITSKSTYHRSMKILHENGYIIYQPSYNPFLGSKVFLVDFTKSAQFQKRTSPKKSQPKETAIEQTSTKNKTAIGTAIETPIEPIYKHINNKTINNTLCIDKQAKKSNKKGKEIIPTLEEVKSYFQEKDQTNVEAEKFYFYFESNGWLVGGKTKMKNWKAAASNWMLNAVNFKNQNNYSNQKPLDTSSTKQYDEPL